MNTRELKNMIRDSILMENELYDFCLQCLNKIYGDDALQVIDHLDDSIEAIEYNGCLQSLHCIDHNFQKQKKEGQERLKNAELQAKREVENLMG